MIALAALSGPLPKLGIVAAAALAGTALVCQGARVRAAAMLAALVLAPVLLLAAIWHSPQVSSVHRHPLEAVVVGLAGIALVAGLAFALHRRPGLLAPLIVFTLPFRIPISAGGTTSNLLVPLYLVVGAGALLFIGEVWRGRARAWAPDMSGTVWVARLLALYVGLYALQAIYSPDFEKALQQMVFFYVPFALLFCLLRGTRWTPELLRRCLLVVVGLALVFVLIGFVEFSTKTLLLNPKLIAQNNVHTYFAINAVFFDPDIFGRFLALVMILVAAVLLFDRARREQLLAAATLAVLWAGLVLTLSRSSLAALLVGLGVLGAMRWNPRPILVGAAVVVAAGVVAVAVSPKTFGLNQGLNGASSGRAGLVSGGAHLFGHRPVWGYGSGSFEKEYRRLNPGTSRTLSASHTIPITIAAEQGLIGEFAYLALVVASVAILMRRARRQPARAAIAAAFLALVFHTLLYADFLEDPVTWTLLGIGVALAVARPPAKITAVEPGELAVA